MGQHSRLEWDNSVGLCGSECDKDASQIEVSTSMKPHISTDLSRDVRRGRWGECLCVGTNDVVQDQTRQSIYNIISLILVFELLKQI